MCRFQDTGLCMLAHRHGLLGHFKWTVVNDIRNTCAFPAKTSLSCLPWKMPLQRLHRSMCPYSRKIQCFLHEICKVWSQIVKIYGVCNKIHDSSNYKKGVTLILCRGLLVTELSLYIQRNSLQSTFLSKLSPLQAAIPFPISASWRSLKVLFN